MEKFPPTAGEVKHHVLKEPMFEAHEIAYDAKGMAWFSVGKVHRLMLFRIWDEELPVLNWVMLNPSIAGAKDNDPTIRRCIGFSKKEGYGGLLVTNLFSRISTDPKGLTKNVPDAAYSDDFIKYAASQSIACMVAWGNIPKIPAYADRAEKVLDILRKQHTIMCLGKTLAGNPRHPVRLPYAQLWEIFRHKAYHKA